MLCCNIQFETIHFNQIFLFRLDIYCNHNTLSYFSKVMQFYSLGLDMQMRISHHYSCKCAYQPPLTAAQLMRRKSYSCRSNSPSRCDGERFMINRNVHRQFFTVHVNLVENLYIDKFEVWRVSYVSRYGLTINDLHFATEHEKFCLYERTSLVPSYINDVKRRKKVVKYHLYSILFTSMM